MNDIQWMRLRRGQHHPADDTVIWWAACESGHELWSGPDRESYDKAKYDAKQHDDDSHSGMETAVVLDTGLVRPASIMTSVINTPATYQPSPSAREAVKSLYDRTIMATFPNYSFVDVKDLVFQ
jgi:hypothetical protein